jgi:hypothetical protein
MSLSQNSIVTKLHRNVFRATYQVIKGDSQRDLSFVETVSKDSSAPIVFQTLIERTTVTGTDNVIQTTVTVITASLIVGIVISMIRAEINDRRDHRRFKANLRRIQMVERRNDMENH